MALATRCLDCGRRTRGSRCASCAARRDNWQARRKIGSGWAWGEVRAQVHARDAVCVVCGGRDGLAVHHRRSLAEGGTNELSRLMGTSVDQIDRTYGQLLPDSIDRARVALDTFNARGAAEVEIRT